MISLVALGVFFSACPVKYGAGAANWIVLVLSQRLGLPVDTSADLASRFLVLVSAVLYLVLGLLAALQLGRIEIGGQPQAMASAVLDFQRVTSRLAALQRAGHKAAILDVHEPIDCLASGVPPCDRYRPLIYNLSFRDRLDQALKRFSKKSLSRSWWESGPTLE